ncbi:hypothetical protein CAL7102_05528 [Dulcicalothrix desertica PCC 7102]|nr:hypothetical protein CAL7102_05528 [Dulcicalothrix desertica PCC 7102]
MPVLQEQQQNNFYLNKIQFSQKNFVYYVDAQTVKHLT